MKQPINAQTWFWLFFSVGVAYIFGLFVPLMNEDASHHANIALHMVQHHDYVNLIDDLGKDYLDKPHLHFWLSALSFNLFGVNTLAYKIPALLATVLGVFSTFCLGKCLYNTQTGLLAALMYATAQAQFLANNDVRMDALLTASIAFAAWQLVDAAYTRRWYHYGLGALGLAMGFCTKGMIGFVTPGLALFFLLVYQRKWQRLFDWRWLLMLVCWAVLISPCVYCYYLQYDLHPEKVVRGMSHISGVKFILWQQNFERLQGKHWGKGHKDYIFFFHTAIWAFLPWCLLTYVAFLDRIFFFIKTRFRYMPGTELLSIGTIIVIFTIISSSGYQLPHYLNVLFPFFGILTAGQLLLKWQEHRQSALNSYLYLQYLTAGVVAILLILLNCWCFPVQYWAAGIVAIIMLAAIAYTFVVEKETLIRLVVLSALTAAVTNVLLNGNVYQQLLNYQSGIGLAQIANRQHISKENIFAFAEHSSAFDFYTQHLTPYTGIDDIKARRAKGQTVWVYTTAKGKKQIQQAGLLSDTAYHDLNYGITRLTSTFLNPATRYKVCTVDYLVKIK